jgi:DNA-binding response OmpR family regulator
MAAETGPRTALVIDDDPGIRALLQEVLADEGYRVECAAGGTAALARLEGAPPAIVLLDLILPDLPGEEVLVALRARWGTALPVLVLSATPQRLPAVEGHAQQTATAYLAKPFELDVLLACLKTLRSPGGA